MKTSEVVMKHLEYQKRISKIKSLYPTNEQPNLQTSNKAVNLFID